MVFLAVSCGEIHLYHAVRSDVENDLFSYTSGLQCDLEWEIINTTITLQVNGCVLNLGTFTPLNFNAIYSMLIYGKCSTKLEIIDKSAVSSQQRPSTTAAGTSLVH